MLYYGYIILCYMSLEVSFRMGSVLSEQMRAVACLLRSESCSRLQMRSIPFEQKTRCYVPVGGRNRESAHDDDLYVLFAGGAAGYREAEELEARRLQGPAEEVRLLQPGLRAPPAGTGCELGLSRPM